MRKLLIVTFLAAGLMSCNNYEKILRSNDVNYRLTKANEYYDKGKYHEAAQVYESLLSALRSTKNYEELYYRYAYSFYKGEDYLNAAYQFKNFQEFFSQSDRLEEMEFMYGVSLFNYSNKPSLDQKETESAISALQTFLILNPDSKYRSEANEYLDQASEKMETKNRNAAQQYYNMDDYKSAAVAYRTLVYDFPDSKNMEEYYYMAIQSMYKYADNSRASKKQERFVDIDEYFDIMSRYYPDSKYNKDIESIKNNIQKQVNQLSQK